MENLRSPDYNRGTIGHTIFFVTFICMLASLDALIPALITIEKDFQISSAWGGVIIKSWFLGNFLVNACILFYQGNGGFSRKMIKSAMIIYVIASITAVFVSSFSAFLLLRFFQGMATAMFCIGYLSMVIVRYSQDDSIQLLAKLQMYNAAVPVLAPSFGGYIIAIASWNTLFIFPALAVFLIYFSVAHRIQQIYQLKPAQGQKPVKGQEPISSFMTICVKKGKVLIALGGSLIGLYIAYSPYLFMQQLGYSPVQYGMTQGGIVFFYILGSLLTQREIKKGGEQRTLQRLIYCSIIIIPILALGYWKMVTFILIISFQLVNFLIGIIAPIVAQGVISQYSTGGVNGAALYGVLLNIGLIAGVFIVTICITSYSHSLLLIYSGLTCICLALAISSIRFTQADW